MTEDLSFSVLSRAQLGGYMQVKGAKGMESGGRPARSGPSLSLGASYINTTAVSYTDGAAVDGTGAEAWNTVT